MEKDIMVNCVQSCNSISQDKYSDGAVLSEVTRR